MFTGIVQAQGTIADIIVEPGMMHVSISVPEEIVEGLKTGASVAVNGVCLTVVSIEGDHITFDVMQETIDLTTLGSLKTGDQVNVERSLKVGDEVGGHLVSGHVHGTARILDITKTENNVTITLEPPAELSKYIFPKGFIALNGVSLTVISTSPLSVSLIPETLERTTFGSAQVGDLVNVEIDQQTRTIVDTIEHITTKKAGF
ncbi:MAG: riboflavin synthase subunit alpha [Patescibacteria group bacterium]